MGTQATLTLENQDKNLFCVVAETSHKNEPTPPSPAVFAKHPRHETREEKLSESDKIPNEKSPRKRVCKDVSDLLSLALDNNLQRHRNVSLCANNVGEGRREKKNMR